MVVFNILCLVLKHKIASLLSMGMKLWFRLSIPISRLLLVQAVEENGFDCAFLSHYFDLANPLTTSYILVFPFIYLFMVSLRSMGSIFFPVDKKEKENPVSSLVVIQFSLILVY